MLNEVKKVLAYSEPVDMRKSFNGLVGLVSNTLNEDPLSGTLFVFVNRSGTLLKSIYWDRTGYCLLAKRLESGRFVIPGSGKQELSKNTLRLILDGIRLVHGR